MRNVLIALAALAVTTAPAAAHEAKKGAITVVHPLLRASIGKAPNSAGYFTVQNAGPKPDRLLSASCACAAKVQAHTVTTTRDGRQMMTPAAAVGIPAKGRVAFEPGSHGQHLMLTGLKAPLEAGTVVPLTLRFEQAGAVNVPFFVTARVEQEIAAHGPKAEAAANPHAGH